LVAVVNRETNRVLLFRDGIVTGSGQSLTSFDSLSNSESLHISRPGYELDGIVDEARIALHPLDANWIHTEYLNQKEPSSFYRVGEESGAAKNEAKVGFTTDSESSVLLSASMNITVSSSIQSLTNNLSPGTSFSVINGTLPVWTANIGVTAPIGVMDLDFNINYPTGAWKPISVINPEGIQKTEGIDWTKSGEGLTVWPWAIDTQGIWKVEFEDRNQVMDLEMEVSGNGFSSTGKFASGELIRFRNQAPSLTGSLVSFDLLNPSGAVWYSTDPSYQGASFSLPFSHRKSISIDHTRVASDLENFPVLIDLYDTDLRTDVRADGADIAFAYGDVILDHEIELFEQTFNGTHAHLIAWVEVPYLSATTDSIISMYYGNPYTPNRENPAGVWDSNFVGVWHLGEIGTGVVDEYSDSSIHSNHGQGGLGNSSYIPTQTTGAIGYGQDFVDHFIDCGNDTSLDITGSQITIQLWMQYPATHPNMGPLNHKGWYNGYRLIMSPKSQKMNFNLQGQYYNLGTDQNIAPSEWHYVVATYDGENMRIHIDGDPDSAVLAKSDDILSSLPEPFRIGHGDHPEAVPWTYPWIGQIDEVRISNVARSSNWISTEYQNQADPQSFFNVGGEESIGYYTSSDISLDASAEEGIWTVHAHYWDNNGLVREKVGSLSRSFCVTHPTSLSLEAPTDSIADHTAAREVGEEVYIEVELTDTVTSSVVSGATVTINWTVLGTPTMVMLNDLGSGRYGKALNTSDLGEARRWRIEFNSFHPYYSNATEYLDIDISHSSYLTAVPPDPIPYSDDFIVKVTLRDAFDNSPLSGASITSNGTFSAAPVDYGNGTYLVTIDSSGYGVGTHVFRITATPVEPLVMACYLDVVFAYRAIDTTAITIGSDPAEVPWGQTVDTNLEWYDIDHGNIRIPGGTVTSVASVQFIDLGDGSYAVTIDTSTYALGTHVIPLTLSLQNYRSATTSITVEIVPHLTSLGVEVNSTTPAGSQTYLSVTYFDIDGGSISIPSSNMSQILVEWIGGSATYFSHNFWLDTSGWSLGIHEINITLQAVSSPRFYEDAAISSTIEVRKLNVFLTWEHLDPFPNGDDFVMYLHVNITEPGTAMDGSPINGIAPGQFSAENDTGIPYSITVTFLGEGRYRLVIGGASFSEGDYKIAVYLDFAVAEIYRDTQTPMITFTYRAIRSSLSSPDYPRVTTTYNTNVSVSLHYVDLDRILNITTGTIAAQGASITWQHVGNGYYDIVIIVLGWNQGTHSVNLTADAVGYEAKTLSFEVIVQIAYAYALPTVTSIDLPLGDTYTFYVDYWDITNDEPIIGAILTHNWTHSLSVTWTGLTYRVDLPSLDTDSLGSYLILLNFSKGQNYQFGYFNVSVNLRTHYTEFRLASIVEPTSYASVVNVSLYYGDTDNDAGVLSSMIDVIVRNQTGVVPFLSLENDTILGDGFYILRISAFEFGPTGLYNFTVYFNWTGPGPKYFNGTTSATVNIIGEESKLTLLDSPGPTPYLGNLSYLYFYSKLYSGDGISNYSLQDVHVYVVFVGESFDQSQLDIQEMDPVGNPGEYTIQLNSTLFGRPGVFTMIVYFNWSSGVPPYYPNKTSVVQVRVTPRNTLLSVSPSESTPYGVNATISFTFDDATDAVPSPVTNGPQMSVVLSLSDYSLQYNDTTKTFFVSFNTSVLGASIGPKSFTITVQWFGTPYYANLTNRVVLITVLHRVTLIDYPTPPPTPYQSNVTF
ncbi:MAG: LamG-like jellyroll fold domain-containing protein, partial [Candidatus Thorarchaeota archaeon]